MTNEDEYKEMVTGEMTEEQAMALVKAHADQISSSDKVKDAIKNLPARQAIIFIDNELVEMKQNINVIRELSRPELKHHADAMMTHVEEIEKITKKYTDELNWEQK